MNEPASSQGLRERLPLAPRREQHFRWRGKEVSRVEGFTDAVFAFAVTLLVVALEVPHTFDGLLDVLRGFPAFVLCFALLMMFWNAHFRYYRRYGLDDTFSRIMTMAILVLVLFFVYPLKYLFTLVTVQILGFDLTNAPHLEGLEQVRLVYLVYGLGLAGVWGLYAALYVHALRNRNELGLSEVELVFTRSLLAANLIYVAVCALSITLAFMTDSATLPGLIYVLLGPLQTINGVWFGRKISALTNSQPATG